MELDRQRSEINPAYDECPVVCERDRKPLNDFCRECEVRPLWEEFEQGAREDLDDYYREQEAESREWSFETLLTDVRRLQRIDATLDGKGYPARCTELVAQSLDVVRFARGREERERDWEAWRKRRDEERNG